VDGLWADEAGVVSTQVLAELYSVLIRKRGVSPADALHIVSPFAAWRVVQIDLPMLGAAMLRNQQDAVAWWDCLVVEAAIRAGAVRLASEDFQRGRRFDGFLEVVDPMAA
jgi:predicted nucleic acid-binding protein